MLYPRKKAWPFFRIVSMNNCLDALTKLCSVHWRKEIKSCTPTTKLYSPQKELLKNRNVDRKIVKNINISHLDKESHNNQLPNYKIVEVWENSSPCTTISILEPISFSLLAQGGYVIQSASMVVHAREASQASLSVVRRKSKEWRNQNWA